MLDFEQFMLNESTILPKNTIIRKDGKTSTNSMSRQNKAEIIAYFEWKGVQDGRTVTLLEPADKEWFKKQNYSTANVFRFYTDNGNTGIFMLDAKKGKVKWFDNETYENTDKITFEPRWYKYNRLIIDNDTVSLNAFDVKDAVNFEDRYLV